MFITLSSEGREAFDNADYATAIDRLTQARNINGEDYDVLSYLASAYRLSGDSANAISIYQEIVEKFPGRRATTAQYYIDQLNGGASGDESGSGTGNDSGGTEDGNDTGDAGTGTGNDTAAQEPKKLPETTARSR